MADRPHLVFVDDDPAEVATFERLYGQAFRVTSVHAELPHMAVDQLRESVKEPPDLLVLDLYFPLVPTAPRGFQDLGEPGKRGVEGGMSDVVSAIDQLRESQANHADDGKRLLREAHAVAHRAQLLLDRWCKELA